MLRVELSFDDGSALDMRLAELLDKYGLTATFYIPAYWDAYARVKGWQPLSVENVKDLSNRFEIGSHGVTHALLTKVKYQVAEFEISASRPLLENLIGKPVTRFSYPRGYATDQIRDIVRKHYLYARSTLVGNISMPEDPVWENTSVHVACQRAEYGGADWFDYGLKLLHMAAARKNGYFHLWGHSHEINRNNGWNGVERLFQEIKAVSDASLPE